MKTKSILYIGVILVLAQFLSGCFPLIVGATGGAAGGYTYSKSDPN
ncbi:MAG: hypothetical protein Q7V63_07640 [Gammaproteobacteria bacterium]|nr:hypothetical protein [Gammaproteobacteria bacterium]